MKLSYSILSIVFVFLVACHSTKESEVKLAKEILGNPNYTAISFGGFREKSREQCPTVADLKEDMQILHAAGIRLIRTYNTQLYPHAERTLQAIAELKQENSDFEMYVMLGAWIACKGAFTDFRDHEKENLNANRAEIKKAIELGNQYADIVKIIAVGNESMVHWAESYFVSPKIILKYVEELQQLKKNEELNRDIWITSSDNFASWGGGSSNYHNEYLTKLIQAVDYVSMHTYPFHDTHYNPEFWQIDSSDLTKDSVELMRAAVQRAFNYAVSQFESTKSYVNKIAPKKAIHIGETGWSTSSHAFYGENGSRAAGEFQQKLYYDKMRSWTDENQLSCFFFEAFDEPWKDLNDERASENHFGLINLNGEAKYAWWELVDSGKFKGLSRNGKPITKTHNGNRNKVLFTVKTPATKAINE